MTNEQFIKMVLEECQRRSFMTMQLSKSEDKRMRQWLTKKARKHMGWTREQSHREYGNFKASYGVETIVDLRHSPGREGNRIKATDISWSKLPRIKI